MEGIDKRTEVEIDNLEETYTFLRGRLEWKLPGATERQKAKQRMKEGTQIVRTLLKVLVDGQVPEQRDLGRQSSSDVWCALQAPHQP